MLTSAGLEEAVALLRMEARDARVLALALVRLDFAALLLRVVLELPLGGAKSLVDHPGGVIVGFVQTLLALDDDVAAGHADRDGDAERALVRLPCAAPRWRCAR